ncbi:hypothetical protein T09_14714 [Trichinella sp. T9]|nr:hypothetical protein T09_14714 [Trichinella sp. T9]
MKTLDKSKFSSSSFCLSSISNLRKPVFNATCAVSVFYANWAVRIITSY